MKSPRRLAAAFALAAVAWTALWPLVSSVEASVGSEAMPLCHMAGMEVSPDQMPAKPGGRGKTHCPLCIMGFHVAFVAPPPAPTFVYSTVIATRDRHGAPHLASFESPLPPSRAPPLA